MSSIEEARRKAQVRWLVLGPLTARRDGKAFDLGAASFPESLAAASLSAQVTVQDRLGGGGTRTFDIAFPKLRAFGAAEVIAGDRVLAALRAVAEELGSGRIEGPAAVAKVKELVGDGAVTRALEETLGLASNAPPATAGPARDQQRGGGAADDIFAKADLPTGASAVSSVIDAVVASARGGARRTGTGAARDVLLAAVQATATDVLGSPAVGALESTWRGLRFLSEVCDEASGASLEGVDVAFADVAATLQARSGDDPFDRPDAVFVLDPPPDVAAMRAVAAIAEDLQAPVVVPLPLSLTRDGEARALPAIAEDASALGPDWGPLREQDPSRWLSVAANRIVLAAEGTGTFRRAVFGSAVIGVAALLARSQRETGGFGRIFGGSGAINAPAVWQLTSGRLEGTAIPTETFVSIEAQRRLASHGLVALGSGRNSDAVSIAAAPTLRASSDAVPLPAQIMTGRIVRFCVWAREQIPAGMSDADIAALFKQASAVFLFPNPHAGTLDVQVVEVGGGRRELVLGAHVRTLAGDATGTLPFQLAFTLPIRA